MAGHSTVEESQADHGYDEADAGSDLQSSVGVQLVAQPDQRSGADEASAARRSAGGPSRTAPAEGAAAGAAGAGPQSGSAPGGAPLAVDWTSWLKQRMSCAAPSLRVGGRRQAGGLSWSRGWR